MSDYLMKCLWKGVADVDQQEDAADRIKELAEERYEAWKRASHTEKMWREAEVKLAWAVGELEEMLMIKNSEAAYGILRVYTKALLVELKGQNDD